MTQRMDATNRAIINELSGDGRRPYSAISQALGITENTVRTRVSKLTESGAMQITSQVNPDYLPGCQVVFMGIKLKTMDLESKAKEFLKLRGVMNVVVVTGRFDLIIQVLLSEEKGLGLLDFFKDEIAQVQDVSEAETFVVYQAYNYWVNEKI